MHTYIYYSLKFQIFVSKRQNNNNKSDDRVLLLSRKSESVGIKISLSTFHGQTQSRAMLGLMLGVLIDREPRDC